MSVAMPFKLCIGPKRTASPKREQEDGPRSKFDMWTRDSRILMRHHRAKGIADGAVTAVSAMQWRVVSQQPGRGGYDVLLRAAQCPRNTCRDSEKCFTGPCSGLCKHMYSCGCPDDNALCKHIHKVRMLSQAAAQLDPPRGAARTANPVTQPDAGSAGPSKRGQDACSSAAGGEEPLAKKQLQTVEWCADCWAEAGLACGQFGHCLLARTAAEEDAQAALAAAHQEMTRQQARLDALAEARARRAAVLTASVPFSEGNEDGWMVEGGSISVALAANIDLTVEDKAAVCAALEDLEMEYQMEEFVSTMAVGDVAAGALDCIVAKLPVCVAGQTARKGAVLLRGGGSLELYFRDTPLSGGRGVRVFGHVMIGLDNMKAVACDGKSHGWWEQYGPYDGCRSRSVDCYCRESFSRSATLSDVEFED